MTSVWRSLTLLSWTTRAGAARHGTRQPTKLRQAMTTSAPVLDFPTTPAPVFGPDTPPVRTIACLVIGDEILNGKTLDTNSHQLARLTFSLGIQLKTIQVIPDHQPTIVESLRALTDPASQIDLVITSGGIGPTHDDITYESVAKVYDPAGELEHHEETMRRMEEHSRGSAKHATRTEEQRLARRRMALFPKKQSDVWFVVPHLWVPVVSLRRKIFILPGVPSLFQQLLQALLLHYIPLPPEAEKLHRVLVQTTLPESLIAATLTRLTKEFEDTKQDIKLGSYPNLVTGQVTISLIGREPAQLESVSQRLQHELALLSQPSDHQGNL